MILINSKLTHIKEKIETIEFFQIDVDVPTHFSFGTIASRQTCMIKFCHGKHGGWAEIQAARNNPNFNLEEWAAFFKQFSGMTVGDAFSLLNDKRDEWPWNILEYCEIALIDLAGKIIGKSALEILGLHGREAIPGVFCILQDKPEKAAEMARVSLNKNLKTHVKIKLFGKTELDVRIIQAVRQVIGSEAFLIGDANFGYGKNLKSITDELVQAMKALRQTGLDACEDPAEMPNEEWITLQNKVGDLALIPDVPARPAWLAVHTMIPGMGRIYNIHPACMGSIFSAVKLGEKIQSFGAKLMIGDASLVGAACTVWQQLAIGLGAAWVEALEKPEESNVFPSCVVKSSTEQMSDGKFGIKELRPGFGLKINEEKLRHKCNAYYNCA